MKEETKLHEENISDKFYSDYKTFKNKLFENLIQNNSQYDQLTLFRKSQKLLDRLLFVFFAEDNGLIPPNAIIRIIDHWKELKNLEKDDTLFSRFQILFNHLDVGHIYYNKNVNPPEITYELPGYNGGLFKPDDILDNPKLIIDDAILLKDCLKLSSYDFNTDIDVNILGHIFEHSINEIEEIERVLTFPTSGTVSKLPVAKRKKDGIFYTPKYITNYIVENTIGKLCKEKKQAISLNSYENYEGSENYEKFRDKKGKLNKLGKEYFEKLQSYKTWLFTLKILDPACGSGAFLNAALDFLINEHRQIDDLIYLLTGDKIRMFDTDKGILENNIFGVDINEESVEIAKLSLWLRTARKDRKLSDLNNNIKCGNSLIDNSEIAGNKAFNWKREFPQIFGFENIPDLKSHGDLKKEEDRPDYVKLIKEKTLEAKEKAQKAKELSNEAIELTQKVYEYAEKLEIINEPTVEYNSKKFGFDIIIGNPPYVRSELIKDKDFLVKNYETGTGTTDLYIYFYELALKLVKPNGLVGFITSNTFTRTSYAEKFRKLYSNNSQIINLFNFGDCQFFNGATTRTAILIARKSENKNYTSEFFELSGKQVITDFSKLIYENKSIIEGEKYTEKEWVFGTKISDDLVNKISNSGIKLKDYIGNNIYRGIITGLNEAFIISQSKKNELIQKDRRVNELIKPLLIGRNINSYYFEKENQYLIFTRQGTNIDDYPILKNYLNLFYEDLKPKTSPSDQKGRKAGKYKWFEIQDNIAYYKEFEKPKIVFANMAQSNRFAMDTEGHYTNQKAFIIPLEDYYLLGLLNSKLIFFIVKHKFPKLLGETFEFTWKNHTENLPVARANDATKEKITSLAKELSTKYKLIWTLTSEFLNAISARKGLIKNIDNLKKIYKQDYTWFITELKKQKISILLKEDKEYREFFNEYKNKIDFLQTEIHHTENKINYDIYNLYELTAKEIEVIENSIK
jgi:type I restriction-modification system DNA methylase subunit